MAQSDTRDYVLAVESNKEAAAAIARETAKSKHHISYCRLQTDLTQSSKPAR